jgi:hypothetical protein
VKRITVTCVYTLLSLCGLAFGATKPQPAKSEFSFAGDYTKPKDGSAVWKLNGSLLFPVGGEYFIAGPEAVLSNNEAERFVAAAGEFNLTGQVSGPFLGAACNYYLRNVAGLKRNEVAARGGFKFGGHSWFTKVYATKVLVDRSGSRAADYGGVIALGGRF